MLHGDITGIYSKVGNNDETTVATYEYDELNQLIKENNKFMGVSKMINDKNQICNMIKKFDFSNAYKKLCQQHYSFCFDNLSVDFKEINSMLMYQFLMYSISKEESVERHLSICNYLYFMEPHITDSDSLIKWHLLRALEISPYDKNIIDNWIFGIYNGNPDCPFSDNELKHYMDDEN